MKKRAIFFGSYEFVLPLLQVTDDEFDLKLIVTTETVETDPVSSYAKDHTISRLAIKTFSEDSVRMITSTNAHVAVLAYFGLFIPDVVLTMFPGGIINIHPSLLPLYRGPSPVQTALLNGDTKTGITLIKLDQELDHGPILLQKEEAILPGDTLPSLHKRLFQKGAELFKEIIPLIQEGKIKEIPQDHTKATFTKRLTRESGYIDSTNPPASDILNRMIRAYYPWPGVWTTIKMKKFGKGEEIQNVRVKLLPNNMIQLEGKKPMTLKDFSNGYPEHASVINHLYQT